jgi:protocatechuate 3,4-dioxygenase beta subunit
MDLNKDLFIPASVFLLFFAFLTLSFTPAESAGQEMPGTGHAQCPDAFIAPLTEGPYYRKGSPERTDLLEEGTVGERVTLNGYVFDRNCDPIAGAWLDFWQADGKGNYDNRGYRLRGHQFTDEQGRYLLRTVIPGEYAGRTNHIHVKVAGEKDGVTTTSQVYFPDKKRNVQDPFFSEPMIIKLDRNEDGSYTGSFNFRLNR